MGYFIARGIKLIEGTFFTLTEAADILGKHRSTISEWLKNGNIKGQRVGNLVLIEKAEVERLQKIKTSVIIRGEKKKANPPMPENPLPPDYRGPA